GLYSGGLCGGCHVVAHPWRGVVISQVDIDSLVAQLARDPLDARTSHAHAGTYRVNSPVIGAHNNLCPGTWVACSRLDLDYFFSNLRHLDLEQLDEHLRRSPAEQQLRTSRLGTHVQQQSPDAVADTEILAWNHVLTRQQTFRVTAHVDQDAVAGDFLDGAGNQATNLVHVFGNDDVPLGFAYLLHDNLLGGLRGDAAELDI